MSTNFHSLMDNMIRDISHACTLLEEDEDVEWISGCPEKKFAEIIRLAGTKKPVIIFIDALDQLDATAESFSLGWLPIEIPTNVKIVISILEQERQTGTFLHSIKTKYPEVTYLRVNDLSMEDRKQALEIWLKKAYPNKKRILTEKQMESVISRLKKCGNPLYLKLVAEEVRRWKSTDELSHDEMSIGAIGKNIGEVFVSMLKRLQSERQHGEKLVKTFLGLLGASRHGLAEQDILSMLSSDQTVMDELKRRSAKSPEFKSIPTVIWIRFYYDLMPYLMERSINHNTLICFFNKQMEDVVRNVFSDSIWNEKLAKHFLCKANPLDDSTWISKENHSLYELPFQMIKSKTMWKKAKEVLTDPYFIEAKSKAGFVNDLIEDYERASWMWPGAEEECRKEHERHNQISVYVNQLISQALNPNMNLLPDPSVITNIQNAYNNNTCEEKLVDLEEMQAWKHFVCINIKQIQDAEEPVFQIAWNCAQGGVVSDKVATMLAEGKGLLIPWIKLRFLILRKPYDACVMVLEGHDGAVNSVAISPDGLWAVSGSNDCSVRMWNLKNGKCVRILNGHSKSIRVVAVTPDGKFAVSGSSDNAVRVWDLTTSSCEHILAEHKREIDGVAITLDGRKVISSSLDKTVRLWDLVEGESLIISHMHLGGSGISNFSPDGRKVIWENEDLMLQFVDLVNGSTCNLLEGYAVIVGKSTLDGRLGITAEIDCNDTYKIRAWDLEKLCCAYEFFEPNVTNDRHIEAAISLDGQWALTAGSDCKIRVWNLCDDHLSRVLEGHKGRVLSLSLSIDGEKAISGSEDCTIRLWDLKKKNECISTCGEDSLVGNYCAVKNICLIPGGKELLSVNLEGGCHLWSLETGKCICTLEAIIEDVAEVKMFFDKRHAISIDNSDRLCIWDLNMGICQILDGRYDGHFLEYSIKQCVCLTPDGCKVVYGGEHGSIRIGPYCLTRTDQMGDFS